MTNVFAGLLTWMHQVFVVQFDAWVLLGFVAQFLFTMRFVVQWLASERAKRSVVPVRASQSPPATIPRPR